MISDHRRDVGKAAKVWGCSDGGLARRSPFPDIPNAEALPACFAELPARSPNCHNPERAAVYSVGFLREVSDLSPAPVEKNARWHVIVRQLPEIDA